MNSQFKIFLLLLFLEIFYTNFPFVIYQFSSVAQSYLTLCDPMNRRTPGLPVHHQLPEFTQTHVHQVSDAIQPSHPLSSPSPLLPIPPSIRVFSNESTVRIRWLKYWSFNLEDLFSNTAILGVRLSKYKFWGDTHSAHKSP